MAELESWEENVKVEQIDYDPWTDRKNTDGIWKCHYPFVIGARKHSNGEAWVVLRAMGTTVAVIWFINNAYSGTVDKAVYVCMSKTLEEATAKAKAFGDNLLMGPIPAQVIEARKRYVEEKAAAGRKGGEKKRENAALKAAPRAPVVEPAPTPTTKTIDQLRAEAEERNRIRMERRDGVKHPAE